MYDLFGRQGFFWNSPNPEIGDTGVSVSVAPGGGGFGGGFPGIYPAMGPGQSGAAGLLEFQERQKKCVESGECPVVWGPAAYWA